MLNDYRDRCIILVEGERNWIHAHLFAKQDKKELEPDERGVARKLASEYATLGDEALKQLLTE